MSEEGVEGDIAFIRRVIQDGRSYAQGRSADLLVWGVMVAAGYLATYAFVRGWSAIPPVYVWAAAILPCWIYSLRHRFAALRGRPEPARNPMSRALSMLWLGCGITMVTFSIAANLGYDAHRQWYDSAVAGVLAIAFFTASYLCNLAWMRAVAAAWWIGELALYALRGSQNALLLGAAMMFFFLAGPGLVLYRSGRKAG